MAAPRPTPYIWATWLATLLVGDAVCQWQYWFQAHNKLTERAPDDFNRIGWRMDHARMADELRRELAATGAHPIMSHKFKIPVAESGIIAGEVDCLVVKEDEFWVYDCKTGMAHSRDSAQVMIYMYALERQPAFGGKLPKGMIVYRNQRVPIPSLPASFESNLNYFTDMLVSPTAPFKSPGETCGDCQITGNDCCDRVQA